MAKARAPRTPRRQRAQRARSPTSGRFKPSKVTKPVRNDSVQESSSNTRGNGRNGRPTRKKLVQLKNIQRGEPSEGSAVGDTEMGDCSTSQTPQPARTKQKRGSIWNLITFKMSFWDTIRRSAKNENPFTSRRYGEDEFETIMNRVSNSVNNQMQGYSSEHHGYMSSSSPSAHDPRETIPITSEDEEELQLAIWPTVQHIVELTGCRAWLPDSTEDYLTQLRGVCDQLTVAWQVLGRPGNASPPYQLEAWTGGISGWRSSFYTNGEERFAASVVQAQLEAWWSEVPSPRTPSMGHNISDNEEPQAITSPYVDSTPFRPRHRRVLSAMYDESRDGGFVPTAAQIEAFQAGIASPSMLGDISMGNRGIAFPSDGSFFTETRSETPGKKSFRIFEDPSTTPPQLSSDPPFLEISSQGSDKENNERTPELFFQAENRRAMEAQRRAEEEEDLERLRREESPSEERRRRAQRAMEEWQRGRVWEPGPR